MSMGQASYMQEYVRRLGLGPEFIKFELYTNESQCVA